MKKKLPATDGGEMWRPAGETMAGGFGYSEARKQLIQRLEVQRDARVVVLYHLADAPGLPRYLFEHLRDEHRRSHERLSLVLFSSGHDGGNVDLAASLSSLLRDHVRQLEVLIPHRGLGLTTLLSFGADSVLMHPLAQVGGLLAAGGLSAFEHYRALHDDVGPFVASVGAETLGRCAFARAQLRTGLVALLRGRVQPHMDVNEPALDSLLTDPTCPLASDLDRRRARDLPWQLEHLDGDAETTLWELHCAFEGPLDLAGAERVNSKSKTSARTSAVLESSESLHVFHGGAWSALRSEELH
jgi:hypothetical protein